MECVGVQWVDISSLLLFDVIKFEIDRFTDWFRFKGRKMGEHSLLDRTDGSDAIDDSR